VTAREGNTANDGLIDLTATAAIDLMRQGDVSAEDYAKALLEQARKFADLNAFRTLDREMLLEAARGADKRRKAGDVLGRLHGLPIPVKDSVNTRDFPTSNGTRALRDFRPKQNAAVLELLLTEGAIVMGKTNLHELSYGWTSNNETFGSVHNPHDRSRIPGGSSGGSAAAVAARIAPLAIGEDTFGSIRVPATCCGLAGLRPTFSRYPDQGIMALTDNKFDQVGPLARAVADLILFDRVATGDETTPTATPLRGVRIGLSYDHLLSGLDPQVERVVTEAFGKLREAGATLVEVATPDVVRAATDILGTILASELAEGVARFLQEQATGLTFEAAFAQVGPSMKAVIESRALPPNRPSREAYEAALARRDQLKATVREWYRQHSILMLAHPVIMGLPPKMSDVGETEVGGKKIPFRVAIGRNVALGSCASMSCLVLPAGETPSGLPVGLEFDALNGQDRELLSVGLSLEATMGRANLPPLLG
jgi:indoleacetamide hydrolase